MIHDRRIYQHPNLPISRSPRLRFSLLHLSPLSRLAGIQISSPGKIGFLRPQDEAPGEREQLNFLLETIGQRELGHADQASHNLYAGILLH